MDNRYSITVRSLLGNKTEHCNELAVQRYDNMDIHELNRWIREMMTECNIDINNHPDLFPDVNEFDIVRMFSAITETLSVLEQEHNSNTVTLKILNAYVTVQVIFSKGGINMTEVMFLKGLCFACFITCMVITIYAIWFCFKNK